MRAWAEQAGVDLTRWVDR